MRTGTRPSDGMAPRTGPRVLRLRPADLANLWVEDPATPSQIALVAELDGTRTLRPDGRLDVERVRDELARRARRVPRLCRRIRWTARGEGRPVWVHDPAFDPAAHITAATLPAGVDLAAWSADRIVRRLDLAAPPWRAEIVEGLPGGRFGLLLVLHHVLADGPAAVRTVAELLDGAPGAPPREPAPPSHRDLVLDARRARRRAAVATLRGLPRLPAAAVRTVHRLRHAAADLAVTASPTSLPRRVAAGRRVAVARFPLDDLRAIGHACGATVNDVLLCAAAGGLRHLLAGRGDPVDGLTLGVSVPVGDSSGQPAGMLLLGLPVGEPDPVRRLAAIAATTARLKERTRSGGGGVFDVLRLPGPLPRLAVRWMHRRAARHVNLFVTDVPGPPRPLWLGEARVLDAVAVAPLAADVPVGIAALSYAGTLAVGITTDAAVTDVATLAAGMGRDVAALAAADPRPGRRRARPCAVRPGTARPEAADRPDQRPG